MLHIILVQKNKSLGEIMFEAENYAYKKKFKKQELVLQVLFVLSLLTFVVVIGLAYVSIFTAVSLYVGVLLIYLGVFVALIHELKKDHFYEYK